MGAMSPDEEIALLRRVAAKDRKAFEALYQRYYGPLFAYLLKITRRADVAEELLQDVLLAVWQRAGRFDGRRSRPSAWIFGIARRKALQVPGTFPPAAGPEDPGSAAGGASPSPHPVQLRRLLGRIDSAEEGDEPGPTWRDRLRAVRGYLMSLAALFARTPGFVRAMIVAQLILLLVLAGAFAALRSSPETSPPPPTRVLLRVVFFPGATEGEIRTMLREIGGRFVDGPSSQGVYTVEVPSSPEAARAALERLRAWPEVRQVETVKPGASEILR